jgi:cysteine desulfurase
MTEPIYLDYNATTPIDTKVAKAMEPFLYDHFGNPSSSHIYGKRTKHAVETARGRVAGLLNCSPQEIIFTSGGTESNNHAIRGVAAVHRGDSGKGHIITSAVEHPAVSEVCRWLGYQGFEVTVLPVDGFGMVDPADLETAIRPETILVSVMHANNEVGTLQPIRELAEICHRHGVLFHTDAAQTVGKIRVDVQNLGIDLLSIAGHKLYAPKGVGALYIREGTQLDNLLLGAGHEGGRRPGTENVLEIVGLGTACEIAALDLGEIQVRFQELRDRMYNGLSTELGPENIRLNGHPEARLPNTLSLCFKNLAANTILEEIDSQVAASAGSACHADSITLSSVLMAMQIPSIWAMGAIRFSVGRGTTTAQIDQAVDVISKTVKEMDLQS